MKTFIDQSIRQLRCANSDTIQEIREHIQKRVENEFGLEAKILREANDELYELEKKFKSMVQTDLIQAYKEKLFVRVRTQVGKNGSIVRDYTGYITKLYDYPHKGVGAFNFADASYNDGNEFTIGLSCFLGIEDLTGKI
jgi:hypothetical protein